MYHKIPLIINAVLYNKYLKSIHLSELGFYAIDEQFPSSSTPSCWYWPVCSSKGPTSLGTSYKWIMSYLVYVTDWLHLAQYASLGHLCCPIFHFYIISDIGYYMYTLHFLYLTVDGVLHCFHILTIVNEHERAHISLILNSTYKINAFLCTNKWENNHLYRSSKT